MRKTQNLWQMFKAEYPAGKGADADYAWQVWRQLLPDEKQAALDGLRLWKASDEWKDRRYIPSAGNFLARQKWKEIPEGETAEPFNPFEDEKPLSQEELFRRRHITSRDAYYMYLRAQDPNNYVYKPRSKA